MDRIQELLAKLSELTAAELTELADLIDKEARQLAASAVTEENLAEVLALRDGRRLMLAEQARRANAATLSARHAAALSDLDEPVTVPEPATTSGTHDPARDQIPPVPVVPAQVEPDAGGTDGGQAVGEPGAADPGGAGGTGEPGAGAAGDGAHAAAGRQLGALVPQQRTGERRFAGQVTATTRVDGNVPGMTAGTQLTHAELIAAFRAKAQSLNSPGAAGKHYVSHTEFSYPEERRLGRDATTNTERMQAATRPNSLTAAVIGGGGLCLPLETLYDINVIGVEDRPVRDALTRFQVERGGIAYRMPFDLLAMASGLGVWTQADDQAVDPATPSTLKTCLAVDCPGVVEASIYSTYLCLEFANMTARFDTEWVDATTRSAMVAWARFAENQLLAHLFAGSKTVKGRHVLGAARDVLINFDQVIAYYRNRHRLNEAVRLHMIVPQWLIQLLRSDMVMAMNTAGDPAALFAIAQATLESWFETRNVNVTWHLDGLPGATVNSVVIPNQFYGSLAAGANVPAFPTSVDSLLYVEGDWLFLDGGTLDLGLVRDSTLNLQNRYQQFVETFEGVAFNGLESLRIVLPLVASGASSGTIDPRAIDSTLPPVPA